MPKKRNYTRKAADVTGSRIGSSPDAQAARIARELANVTDEDIRAAVQAAETTPPVKLTAPQMRKLRYIAKQGETRNPGDLTTTNSLVVRGLVEAVKHGTFPHAYMTYCVTDAGRAVLETDDAS